MVTGTARYTFDLEVEGLLHMKLLRSPHPHARIVSVDTSAALRAPGVRAVFTHHDAPERLYSSARHEHPTEDPDDTRPVAPAFANALRDATGIRFTGTPFLRDQVWQAIDEHRRGGGAVA